MGISVQACKRCRRLFNYPGFGQILCSDCREREEADFARVKEFLRNGGPANCYEIALATGISEKDVRQWLKDGRLEIPEGSDIYIKCERCGQDIRSGRYCPSCAAALQNELSGCYIGIVGDVPKNLHGKMRFLGERK